MCGIAGFTGSINPGVLKRMTNVLAHRGPDEEIHYQDEYCSLGMRRLAIVDLTPGIYPLTNEQNNLFCIVNGEIYNFFDLKKRLFALGHRFKTQTDGEVIVHGYEAWGERVLQQLNGMFAICLYDKRQKKIILARDRLGKKPLYWSLVNNSLIFASEIKAILAHPTIKRDLDFNALYKYLAFEYVPCPMTIFKNIYKLEAGHYLVFTEGKVKIEKYWEAFQDQKSNSKNQKYISKIKNYEEDLIKELDYHLQEAVKLRLIADVPVGVFLSGGIDSATIAYYASRLSKHTLHSFSVGFSEASFDESGYARLAAECLGTHHHEQRLDSKKALEIIPELYGGLDEPFADPSLIPTYYLSKFARQKVTVALSGDGGDELFLGYPTFMAYKIAQYYKRVPKVLRNSIFKLLRLLPVSYSNLSFDFLAKTFLKGLDYPELIRNQMWLGIPPHEFADQILQRDIRAHITSQPFEDIERYEKQAGLTNTWQMLVYLYLKTYLEGDILTKIDRAGMYTSLEVRSPFLDYTLVDFVNSLDVRYKLRNVTQKYLLKQLMQGRLPSAIIKRRKKGFGIPMGLWLLKDLKELMLELLSPTIIKRDGLLVYPCIKRLIDDHLARRVDNRKPLWTLMCFQLWKRHFMK